MIGGRHDRLDTSLMKAVPGRVISKAGMEALRGIAILPGSRTGTQRHRRRPGWPSRSRTATATTAGRGPPRSRRSARPACSTARRSASSRATTARRCSTRTVGSARRPIPEFELAPVGELIG